MKKVLFIVLGMFWGLTILSVRAQRPVSLFQPLSWEQASLLAARENKLVLVEVGDVDAAIERGLQKHPELMNYLNRNLVAIRMDMNSGQGRQFEQRLLMYPWPAFAFFLPYGDLVGTISPEMVKQRPEALRETLEKAQELAKVKKMNSRLVAFEESGVQQAFERAWQEDKLVYIYLTGEKNQASLLLERNVFNLDRVADFYNRNFINLRLDTAQSGKLSRKYGIQEFPAFLFLNANGKLLFKAQGYAEADQLLDYGQKALEKAKGIPFQELSTEQAQKLAKEQDKLVFTDYYITGSVHKELVRTIFSDPEVTDFFKASFISVSSEAEQPALVFSDGNGKELHRIVRVDSAGELLEEARKVLAGEGLADMQLQYQQGERQAPFLEKYIKTLGRAGKMEEAAGILMVYLGSMSPEKLKEARYWELFDRYGANLSPEYFDYILSHRNELYALYGEEKVRKKVTTLWVAGAENFVKEGKFDEVGFKAYAKRLKKEKVEGARFIIRNARMHAAEKVGDWKVYITLAEEKWNEEKISDSELYRWGVMINERCQDEGLRYKMAQWLAGRAMDMERKEQISGKVKVSSYRGFFEKLVNDLLKK